MPPTPRIPLQGPAGLDQHIRRSGSGSDARAAMHEVPMNAPSNRSQFGGFPSIMPMMPMFGFGNFGGGGNGFDNPFMKGLYALNSSMFTLSQMFMIMNMNTQSLYGMYMAIKSMYVKLVDILHNSNTMRWLRQKTKKSMVLRWTIVVLVAYLSTSAYWLLKKLLVVEYSKLMIGR